MAWQLLMADPNLKVLGISVVAGNAPLEVTLSNALRIKDWNRWAIGVHAGCAAPLRQAPITAADVLGPTAMATVGRVLPSTDLRSDSKAGVDALIDAVRANPGQLTILALGPLTNIACAFLKAPDLPTLIDSLVWMGGSTDRGNATPAAEFNAFADPEALDVVLNSRVNLFMVGLNACRQVLIGSRQVDRLRQLRSERAQIFADHLDAYVGIARRRGALEMAVYDPTAAAYLSHPEWFSFSACFVAVELTGSHTRGMTVCDFRPKSQVRAQTKVATVIESEPLLEWMLEQLTAELQ